MRFAGARISSGRFLRLLHSSDIMHIDSIVVYVSPTGSYKPGILYSVWKPLLDQLPPEWEVSAYRIAHRFQSMLFSQLQEKVFPAPDVRTHYNRELH